MLPTSSENVQRVIKRANAIAREYDREYVGTEHLLLGILDVRAGRGAEVLARLGVTMESLRREVDSLVKKSLEETWVFGRLPGTPHFKNVMSSAVEQCVQLEAREMCSEHLLLALLKERGCIACRALAALGVTYDKARQAVLTAATG